MTWLDLVLVTLLALITAVGARRGLAGLLWGVGAVAACWLSNVLAGPAALLVSAVLGVGLAVSTLRFEQRQDIERPAWHALLGGLGGALFGVVCVCALALGFPLQVRGNQQMYPSPETLTGPLYSALKDSYIQNSLQKVWVADGLLQTLLIPDQRQQPESSEP